MINREAVNRLYTGGTEEQLSGLVHLEARHYSPEKAKFIQPDPYNLAELQLPAEARNLLVKQSEITLEDLLKDPAQQLDTSYVSGNPHKWVDPLGLWTRGIGGSITVNVPGFTATVGVQVTVDDDGNTDTQVTVGTGSSFSTAPGISVSIDGTVTNADTVNDLNGTGGENNVSASVGVAVGVSLTGGGVYGNGYVGTTGSFGVYAGVRGISQNNMITYTSSVNCP